MAYGLNYTTQFYDHFDTNIVFNIYKKDFTSELGDELLTGWTNHSHPEDYTIFTTSGSYIVSANKTSSGGIAIADSNNFNLINGQRLEITLNASTYDAKPLPLLYLDNGGTLASWQVLAGNNTYTYDSLASEEVNLYIWSALADNVDFSIVSSAKQGEPSATLTPQSANLNYSFNGNIISLSADLNFVNNFSNFKQFDDLFRNEDREYKLIITRDSKTLFNGYLICDLIEQPFYNNGIINLKFTDYLKLLTNIYPSIITADRYARKTLLEIINNILSYTTGGEYLPIYINNALYHTGQYTDTGKTLFEQTYINVDLFWNNDNETENAYDILNSILKSFNCILYQYNGYWIIERYNDIMRDRDWTYFPVEYWTDVSCFTNYTGTNATDRTNIFFYNGAAYPDISVGSRYVQNEAKTNLKSYVSLQPDASSIDTSIGKTYGITMNNNVNLGYLKSVDIPLPTEDLYDGEEETTFVYTKQGWWRLNVSTYVYDKADNLLTTGNYNSGMQTGGVVNFNSLNTNIYVPTDKIYFKNSYVVENFVYQRETRTPYIYNDPPGTWSQNGAVVDLSTGIDASIYCNVNSLNLLSLILGQPSTNRIEIYIKDDKDFEYTNKTQSIGYNSGAKNIIINLQDESQPSLIINNCAKTLTDLPVIDVSYNPYDSSIALKTWTGNNRITVLTSGYNKSSQIKNWIYWAQNPPAAIQDVRLFYKFIDTFDNTTEALNIKYKATVWNYLNYHYTNCRVQFSIRAGKDAIIPNGWIFQDTNGDTSIRAANDGNEYLFYEDYDPDLVGLTFEINKNINLRSIYHTSVPKTQTFIIGIQPIKVNIGGAGLTYQNFPIVGDFEVTIGNTRQIPNKYDCTLDNNFLRKEDYTYSIYDVSSLNYKNSLYLDVSSPDSMTYSWMDPDDQTVTSALAYMLLKGKYNNSNKTRLTLYGDLLINEVPKPLSVLYDYYIQRDDVSIPFTIQEYSYDLRSNICSMKAFEYPIDVSVDPSLGYVTSYTNETENGVLIPLRTIRNLKTRGNNMGIEGVVNYTKY